MWIRKQEFKASFHSPPPTFHDILEFLCISGWYMFKTKFYF